MITSITTIGLVIITPNTPILVPQNALDLNSSHISLWIKSDESR